MASDHRGRGVHAGKRTNQEMPNATEEAALVKKSAPVYESNAGTRNVEKRLGEMLFAPRKK